MRRILIMGGTTFVSRNVAEYFLHLGDEVWVLNRGSRPQVEGVNHIMCDRHDIGERLKDMDFDAVLDVTAYSEVDVRHLLSSLGAFGVYIMVSSSAVYPETEKMPLKEGAALGPNSVWGKYGENKIAAENYLKRNCEQFYILRPPYLYGEWENLYREPFVFDCAINDRVFVLPPSDMKLQFFYVKDLCRFMDVLIRKKPSERIYNLGNTERISIKNWVTLCYEAFGKKPKFTVAETCHPIRDYFCFYEYDYELCVDKMLEIMPEITPLSKGLKSTSLWYMEHEESVSKKPYMEHIDKKLL